MVRHQKVPQTSSAEKYRQAQRMQKQPSLQLKNESHIPSWRKAEHQPRTVRSKSFTRVSRLETTPVVIVRFRLGASPFVEQRCPMKFDNAAKGDNFAMPTADWYRRKADECVAPPSWPPERREGTAIGARRALMRLATDAINSPQQHRYRARTLSMPAAGSDDLSRGKPRMVPASFSGVVSVWARPKDLSFFRESHPKS